MKNVITKELISKINEDSKSQTSKLTPFDFSQYTAIGIGANVVVRNPDGSSYVYLGENVKKDYMREWNKGVGKILARDFRTKNIDPYFLFTTETYKVMLRRIEEDRLAEMEELGFKNLEIGDYFYTIIKETSIDEAWRSVERISEDVNSSDDEEPDGPTEEEQQEEEEQLESVSLFD